MIHKLRRRLTLIFTALTSLILCLLLFVAYSMSMQQYTAGADALYQTTVTTVVTKLQTENTIRDLWLASVEAEYSCVIHIEDMGVPLHFLGAWKPATDRMVLIEQAKSKAEDKGLRLNKAPSSSLFTQQVTFTITGQAEDTYQTSVVRIPANDGWFNLVLLQDISDRQGQILKLLLIYIGLGVVGIAALYVVNWFLAGRAIRPTAEAIRQQNDFVAAASHELRNPLAVIHASIFAAKQQPEEAPGFLDTAMRETERLSRLTNDLFMLTGSDAKTWSLVEEPVEVDTLCIEVYEQTHLLATQKGHTLSLNLPGKALPTINADKGRLVQLLSILLSNAMDYAPAGTPIELDVQADRHNILISVIDHGPGIPDECKKRVFERFYRADKSRSDKEHFGLGLSVAHELAALHGGTLTVTDTPGGGATFTLALPL